MFCRHCGKELKNDAAFCIYCGKSLAVKKENIPEQNTENVYKLKNKSLDTQNNEAAKEKTASPTLRKQPNKDQKSVKPKRKFGFAKLLAGLVILAVLILGIGFALAHFGIVEFPAISSIFGEHNVGSDRNHDETDPEESGAYEITDATDDTVPPTEDPAEAAYKSAESHCEELAFNSDFEGAVIYLRECVETYPDDIRYIGLLTVCEDALCANVLQCAQEYADQQQYLQAMQVIQDVQDTYNCSEFEDLITQYIAELTCPLSACTVLSDSNANDKNTDVAVDNWTDSFRNSHPDSLRFWVVKKPYFNSTEFVEYDLAGQYQTLSGVIVADKDSDAAAQMEILIYLDGELVYQSGTISYTSEPVEFTINVTDTQRIRVECTTESPEFGYCIVDAILSEI